MIIFFDTFLVLVEGHYFASASLRRFTSISVADFGLATTRHGIPIKSAAANFWPGDVSLSS